MEVLLPCDKSDHLDICSSSWSSVDSNNPIQCSSTDLSMNDLNTCFAECLNIEDREICNSGLSPYSGKNDIGNGVREHEYGSNDKVRSSTSSSDKCLRKCATFPAVHEPKSSDRLFLDEEEKHEEGIAAEVPVSTKPPDQHFLRSISLPVPSTLISAMKGSRLKQGLPPKKASVTWAPEVYDPVPTSLSHLLSNMNQHHRNDRKKSGKYKKGSGKYSQGGNKGKGKNQCQKNNGNLVKLKSFHGGNGVVDFGQVGSIQEFKVGSPNWSREKSSLRTGLHFPGGEDT